MEGAEASIREWLGRRQQNNDFEENFRVLGQSPLEFAIATYNEELALDILSSCSTKCLQWQVKSSLQTVINKRVYCYSCLHLAIQGSLVKIIPLLARPELSLLELQTPDLKLPFDKLHVEPGGKTPLHLAIQLKEFDIARTLIRANANLNAVDFDGNTPFDIYQMYCSNNNNSIVDLLPTSNLETGKTYREKIMQDKAQALVRYKESLHPKYTSRLSVPNLLSLSECEEVLQELLTFASTKKWTESRHQAFATVDIPSSDIKTIDKFVRNAIETRLFPRICSHYKGVTSLSFRDLFFVMYDADGGRRCAELALHQDGSDLSFNILLNPSTDFVGGGTYFETDDVTETLEVGGCLVHSGKVRHGGALVTSGKRFILVGFLNVI